MYYYNITAPNENTYLLIYATDGEDSSVQVVRVGSPTARVWFWDGGISGGETIPYYGFNYASQFESGNMTDLSNGFYHVDSSSWIIPWFANINEDFVVKHP